MGSAAPLELGFVVVAVVVAVLGALMSLGRMAARAKRGLLARYGGKCPPGVTLHPAHALSLGSMEPCLVGVRVAVDGDDLWITFGRRAQTLRIGRAEIEAVSCRGAGRGLRQVGLSLRGAPGVGLALTVPDDLMARLSWLARRCEGRDAG